MQERFAQSHPWVHVLDVPSYAGLARRMAAAQELVPQHGNLEPCTPSISYPAWSPESGFQPGHFQVVSCTHPGVMYTVSLAHGCTCPDASTKAPFGWCKHRLAVWLYVAHLAEHGSSLLPQKESAQAVA